MYLLDSVEKCQKSCVVTKSCHLSKVLELVLKAIKSELFAKPEFSWQIQYCYVICEVVDAESHHVRIIYKTKKLAKYFVASRDVKKW
jgi:hypothetical protein